MKILRLLNRKYLSIILILLLGFNSFADDKPVDIWNIDKKEIEKSDSLNTTVSENNNFKQTNEETNIFNMQSNKENELIEIEKNLNSNDLQIIGLYDPEDFGLDINMWKNSDGDQLKNIFSKLNKMDLSDDATEIMNISMLTNAYHPEKNISKDEFLSFKSDWLIKSSDLDIIEEYLLKNQIINIHPKLTRYIVDQYLSISEIQKACDIFINNLEPINDEYLTKFNIYCLIKNNRNEDAQLILDLKKELGFQDKYFEKKVNFLLGFDTLVDEAISEKSILDFHLAHLTNPNFAFEPKEKTDKMIWKYLSSSNLLSSFDEIDITDLEKISNIELAVHNKNYPEKDLLKLYMRFQFTINQLLNANELHKSMSNIEARALIYQKILLESEMVEKLKLLKILKKSFKDDNLDGAFDIELKKFLGDVNPLEIPDNLTSFYYTNIKIKEDVKNKIKYDNDILHQSKLVNYFNGDYPNSKIEKDVNNFLRKIKKNKKYFLSKKDIIFLESIKSDGVKIDQKFENLYEIDASEIPTDIQVMINNNEKGAALLRIVEVIGKDKLERMDEDTMYFIISTLNQLDIRPIRNKILLKVLPLKV